MAKFSKSGFCDKVPQGRTVIFGDTHISTVWDRWKEASITKTGSISPVVSTQYRRVTDGQTDTRRVKGVDGSCAEHLTVESYTVIIFQQSSGFHHPLAHSFQASSLPFLQILPTAAFPILL